ncbi:ATP-binding cassette domain-containing protein [Faucicola mancuniensis]|uniref:ATP-binding cassette domain-containing protein n=1 Tax=Faucicola mancuniensis TaxID=1309795 RepID=UPI0028E6AAED|nr:ATP-binding cassette domain-containing protein [uncultured Moraxella sp.]
MITIENVSHHIDNNLILNNINLNLTKEQVIALIGPNGAGKSTLFTVMARLNPLQTGKIRFDDHDILTTDSKILAKTVAMLAQENHIQGRLTVAELLMFGRYPYHQGRPTAHDEAIVKQVMARFELDTLATRYLATLSGGQRQRVLIAMIVCQDTPFVLLDEPLNNLDMYHAGKLMRILRTLVEQDKKTVVIVLHDINQASQFADTVVMMKKGEIVSQGRPVDVLTKERIFELFGVNATVLEHNGRPVIVDTI